MMPALPKLFWAYIDPVSGSILLQVIVAGAIGTLGYFFRPLVRVFRAALGLRREEPKPPSADNQAS